jgi:hypothetical protein
MYASANVNGRYGCAANQFSPMYRGNAQIGVKAQ